MEKVNSFTYSTKEFVAWIDFDKIGLIIYDKQGEIVVINGSHTIVGKEVVERFKKEFQAYLQWEKK